MIDRLYCITALSMVEPDYEESAIYLTVTPPPPPSPTSSAAKTTAAGCGTIDITSTQNDISINKLALKLFLFHFLSLLHSSGHLTYRTEKYIYRVGKKYGIQLLSYFEEQSCRSKNYIL